MYTFKADCFGVSLVIDDIDLVANDNWGIFMKSAINLAEEVFRLGTTDDVLEIRAESVLDFEKEAIIAKEKVHKASTEDYTEVDTVLYTTIRYCSFKSVSYSELFGKYMQKLDNNFSYLTTYTDIMFCEGYKFTIDYDYTVNFIKSKIQYIDITGRIYTTINIDDCETAIGVYSPLNMLDDEDEKVLDNCHALYTRKMERIRCSTSKTYRRLTIQFEVADKAIIIYPEYDLYFRPESWRGYEADSASYFPKGLHYVEGIGEELFDESSVKSF